MREALRRGAFRAAVRLGAVLAAVSASAAVAQPVAPGQEGALGKLLPPVPGQAACFTRSYDARHLARHPRQRVTALRFRLAYHRHPASRDDPQGQRNYTFQMSARLKGERRTLVSGGECAPGRGSIACGVDCDGGGIQLRPAPDGRAIVIGFDRFIPRLRMSRGCSEEDTVDLTPGADDRSFRLARAALSECAALARE